MAVAIVAHIVAACLAMFLLDSDNLAFRAAGSSPILGVMNLACFKIPSTCAEYNKRKNRILTTHNHKIRGGGNYSMNNA